MVSKMAESERGYSVKTAGYTSEIIDSTAFVLCGKNALVLDSILTEQGAYVLMTVREDLSESDGNPKAKYSRGLVTSSPQPAWIMTPPSKSGYLYGIGVSGRYRKEADSWDYAAKYARREVAMQLFTRKSTLRESVETDFANYNRKWSEDVADVILSTQKIVERWYDPEYDLFYCLISYKIPDSTDPK